MLLRSLPVCQEGDFLSHRISSSRDTRLSRRSVKTIYRQVQEDELFCTLNRTTCCICFEFKQLTTTFCAHELCSDCLDNWLRSHTTCPFCRTILREQIGSDDDWSAIPDSWLEFTSRSIDPLPAALESLATTTLLNIRNEYIYHEDPALDAGGSQYPQNFLDWFNARLICHHRLMAIMESGRILMIRPLRIKYLLTSLGMSTQFQKLTMDLVKCLVL